MADWSLGDYAAVARELEPVAEAVVAAHGPPGGLALLDVGCGDGNAAIVAARLGAAVTGVDPEPRLLEAARARAEAEGLRIDWVEGEAAGMPLATGSFERIVSVFGVMFSPDHERAVRELRRVAANGALLAMASWVPEGPIARAVGRIGAELGGGAAPTGPSPAGWGRPDYVAELLAHNGFVPLAAEERGLRVSAPSAAQWVAEQERIQPTWVAAVERLGARWPPVRHDIVAELEAGSEDPAGLALTSRWLLMTARASG